MARRSRLARGSRQGILLAACALALTAPTASADIGFLGKWGSAGTGDSEFVGPRSLALDSAGDVYVVDGNLVDGMGFIHRVQKFTANGSFITKFGSAGSGAGQFYGSGVVAASPSDIYVVDEFNAQVERFTSTIPPTTYAHAGVWGAPGVNPGQLVTPRGVALDASGNLYVAEFGNDRVQKFDLSGNSLDTLGGEGSADGEMNQPSDVTVAPDGTVYVADTSNHRVQRFSATGDFMAKWGGAGAAPGQMVHPYGVATDSAGNVYVADSGNDRIQKFSANGTFISEFGSSGSGDGQMEGPGDVVVSPTGIIFVLDGGNYRIQKFGEGGAPISKSPGGSSTPPKKDEKKPKKTSSLWRLIPPGPGCENKNGQMCYVEIVIPEPGEITADTASGKAAAAAKRERGQAKPGIQRVSRRVNKAGKIRLQLKLNRSAKKVVKRKGKIAVRIRLTFAPKQGKAISTTRTFTFKKKPKKRP
jgi:DNA-binding beta-propeller fold protein YncE